MPIDSLFVYHLANELNDSLNNSNVKKIYNITENEYLIKFHNKKNLYINLSSMCRVNLTNKEYTFPTTPSNLTMVLRKYINNFKIINVTSYKKDRIIQFTFAGLNELKDETIYYVYIELFGRYSNLVLTSEDNTIISALKHVSNEHKTILNGAKYIIEDKDDYVISSKIDKDKIKEVNPTYTTKDFYFTNVFENGTSTENISQVLEDFYSINKDHNLLNLAKTCDSKISKDLKRYNKKLEKLNQDLTSNLDHDKYKDYGDLILTYGFQNKVKDVLICQNLNGEEVKIPLDPLLTTAENANSYYKKYRKLKRSIEFLEKQIEETELKIEYLENLKFQVSICSENEVKEILNELQITKVKKQNNNSKVLVVEYEDYKIYIGKNNVQNDYITFKLANKNDIWFHVVDLPGSHVLLKYESEITNEMIENAASLAGYYSKGRSYPKVEVMYTKVRNVKKVSNSYLGHVSILNNFETVYIEPRKEIK